MDFLILIGHLSHANALTFAFVFSGMLLLPSLVLAYRHTYVRPCPDVRHGIRTSVIIPASPSCPHSCIRAYHSACSISSWPAADPPPSLGRIHSQSVPAGTLRDLAPSRPSFFGSARHNCTVFLRSALLTILLVITTPPLAGMTTDSSPRGDPHHRFHPYTFGVYIGRSISALPRAIPRW